MVDLFVTRMSRWLERDEIERLSALIDERRRERIGRYRRIEDAQRSLVAGLLLRRVVVRRCRLAGSAIRYEYGEHGKPSLAGFPDFRFNLSHAGRWVICAVSDSEVGADVEEIRAIDPGLYDMVLTDGEKAAAAGLPEPERLRLFYKAWTLKESVVKCIGAGLAIPFRSLDVIRAQYPGTFAWKSDGEEIVLSMHTMQMAPDCVVSVCNRTSVNPVRLRLVPLDLLMTEWDG